MKEYKVEIHKIIKFSDQAPSQYKNKTSFDYLTKVQKPTMHCFFGVRHGKGPCDACTGCVKQAVKCLIKSGTSTVDTAEAFYKAAKDHLTTEKSKPGKCVHFKQTFHFTNKIPNRPKANTRTAVPETCQLHAACNTGNAHVVNTRKIPCCCINCIRQHGQCENVDISDQWQAFNMQTKKVVPLSWTLWATQPTIHNIAPATKTWNEQLHEMSFRNYAQLQQYVTANPFPEMEIININDVMLDSEKSCIDFIALHHLPTDAPDGYAPLKIHGDGNSFPRVCSYLVSKHEDRYDKFCVRVIYELVQRKGMYLNNDYISKGVSIIHRRGSTVD